MKIQKATIDDSQEILDLQKLAYQSEAEIYDDFTIPPLDQSIEEITEEFSHKKFLKAILGDEIIGSVRAHQENDTCYIGKLIVHPKYQNQGIGTNLINTIESYFTDIKRYELFTGEKSEKNLYLYQKLGYEIYKTERLNEKVTLHYLEKSFHEKIMKDIKESFEDLSPKYDKVIKNLIPYYEEMLDAVVNSIPFNKNESFKVIDLGWGTGNLSKKVHEAFPNSSITCVDMSPNMIEVAKQKLKNHKYINFILAEFSNFTFQEKYDVVISSLSLHHLITDEDKIHFYREIYDNLNENGVFFNFDNVLGANETIQRIYIEVWKDFLENEYPIEKIEGILKQHYREDKPAILFDHLKWLEEVGFRDIDVIYKYYHLAVYGGFK